MSESAATLTDGQGVTLASWADAPFSAWAFQHMRDLMPVAEIANAPQSVWSLTPAPRSLAEFSVKAPTGEPLDLAGFLTASSTDAMVVLKDGELVFETYANGMTPLTPHILMSSTKAVTGLVASILKEQGRLDPEALVTRYVPEVAGTAYDSATVRHLMDMRTGFRPDAALEMAYTVASGWAPVPEGQGPADLKVFYAALPAEHEPHGGPFAYISANTDLLGWALERASGARVADLISELLWKPMGAEAPAYITTDSKGVARCTGGLNATARDFARLGQLVLNKGCRGGIQIVPAEAIFDIEHGGDPEAWAKGAWGQVFGFAGSQMRYRVGWYGVDAPRPGLFAMGVHGQNLFIDRAERVVIAKLSHQPIRFDYPTVVMTHRAADEIRRCLSD